MESPIITGDHHLSSSQFHQEILISSSLSYSQKKRYVEVWNSEDPLYAW